MSVPLPVFTSPESRWTATRLRTPSAHSSFVYAVKTTRIYCRPTCPARLARRANVLFFDAVAAAAAAGFRPCRRCKPDAGAEACESRQEEAVRTACRIIEQEQGRGRVGVNEVAARVGLSERYFRHVFKKMTGMTPGEYAKQHSRGEHDQDGVTAAAAAAAQSEPSSGALSGAIGNCQVEHSGSESFLLLDAQPVDLYHAPSIAGMQGWETGIRHDGPVWAEDSQPCASFTASMPATFFPDTGQPGAMADSQLTAASSFLSGWPDLATGLKGLPETMTTVEACRDTVADIMEILDFTSWLNN